MSTFLAIHWNASPEFFSLGPISVRWYGLMFAMGFLLGFSILTHMLKFEGSDPVLVEKLFVYVIIATIVGARLGHVIFYGWEYYSTHLIEIFLPIAKGDNGYKFVGFQGLASHGGAMGIIVAVWLFSIRVTKRPILWTLDRLVVPIALVGAMIRFGNLMNSEIYGVATNLPWGFIFERNNETIAKHPTAIYESICYLLSFGLLLYFYYKKKELKDRTGFLTGVFFIAIFSARFFIEFIKENQESFESGMSLNMGQILSIPFVVAGIALVYFALTRPPVIYSKK